MREAIEALAPTGFDLVVANLLSSEARPLLAGLAARTRAGGQAVFSGLLAAEIESFSAALARAGLAPIGIRELEDASGDRMGGAAHAALSSARQCARRPPSVCAKATRGAQPVAARRREASPMLQSLGRRRAGSTSMRGETFASAHQLLEQLSSAHATPGCHVVGAGRDARIT